MGLHFDTTIHLSDLAMMIGVIWGFGRVFLKQRDFNRDILRIIGVKLPAASREGILGDIEALKESRQVDHEQLAEVRVALGFTRRGNDPLQPMGRQ